MIAAKRKPLSLEQRRKIYCVKNGHSRLREYCFGYHSCARCGETLGDSLGGAYSNKTGVYISHMHTFTHEPEEFATIRDCPCPTNAKALTKRDLALVPQWDSSGREQRPPWRQKEPRK